ncbi:MAG: hypothetical protein KA297_15650 [Kofleriaceae bacterium]|nr:hypothetical protein [Kofleriaceae bacterium]MBP6838952.1 hypothetical protein [Kofleriaceae bacterium]
MRVALVASLMLGAATAAAAPPALYPLDQVRRGQTGYGMTTFKGATPERFTFEVLSVARNFLPMQDIILVKSDDPKLAVTGFWRGMSGSPLYLDDKLVCAFSYGWSFNKVVMGGCTPIGYMLKEGATPRRSGPSLASTRTIGAAPRPAAGAADWRRLAPSGRYDDLVRAVSGPASAGGDWLTQLPLPAPAAPRIDAPAMPSSGAMTAAVPLLVSGFSGRSFARLEQLFGGHNLVPMQAGGGGGVAAAQQAPAALQMGGSISVLLGRGDMSMAATGTVSYIDRDKVLAFGHPMFQAGEIYAPVATAYVHTVVASAQFPFVMASYGNEVGSLTQDRQSMIAADTTLRSPMVPLTMTIQHGEGAAGRAEFKVDLLHDRFITAGLAAAAADAAVNKYLPDREHVAVKIDGTVRIRGAGDIRFVDYLAADDGAGSVIGGARALRVLVPLLMNPFVPVAIERIDLAIDLRFAAASGDIVELRLPGPALKPGVRNTVEVVLDTFEGGRIVERVPVDVPAKLAGSIVQLEISAGDAARLDAAPPVDLPTLMAAFRAMLPGTVWAASLYGADEGIAVRGKVVRDIPASAQDRLRPATRTQRVTTYLPVARTLTPASRVLSGSTSVLVRVGER